MNRYGNKSIDRYTPKMEKDFVSWLGSNGSYDSSGEILSTADVEDFGSVRKVRNIPERIKILTQYKKGWLMRHRYPDDDWSSKDADSVTVYVTEYLRALKTLSMW